MAEMMVGSTLQTPERSGREFGKVALDVSGLSVPSPSEFGTALRNVHLTVREGEVLGIGGVAGNGQDELLGILSGEILTTADAVKFNGQAIGNLGPTPRRKLGVLTAPEERAWPCSGSEHESDRKRPVDRVSSRGSGKQRLSEMGRNQELCRKDHQDFRRPDTGSGKRGAVLVRR